MTAFSGAIGGPNSSGDVVENFLGAVLINSSGVQVAVPDPPGYLGFTATALNDSNEIVGFSGGAVGTSLGEAFVDNLGTFTDLHVNNACPTGINNSGQVAGFTANNNGYQAFIYSNGAMTPLGFLGSSTGSGLDNGSAATAINNSGDVVGSSGTMPGDDPPIHAFLYDNGTMTDLGTLGGSYSFANAVNDSGEVVGYSTTASNQNP
jgi:probable HAF family extracellular repeat protein